jgi:hypothetical protein
MCPRVKTPGLRPVAPFGTKKRPKPSLSSRHSRLTLVSYTGSAEITAKQAGHSVNVMFDRYQKIVTKQAAELFWQIRPSFPNSLYAYFDLALEFTNSAVHLV